MRQTTQITIEHIVVASDRSYEQVIEALEAQLGLRADWEKIARALITPQCILGASSPDRRAAAWNKRVYHLE